MRKVYIIEYRLPRHSIRPGERREEMNTDGVLVFNAIFFLAIGLSIARILNQLDRIEKRLTK